MAVSLLTSATAQAAEGITGLSPAIPLVVATTAFEHSELNGNESGALSMAIGDDIPAIEAVVELMRNVAGRYSENKMVLSLIGIGKHNTVVMYVEEVPGRVRSFNPHFRFPITDESLHDACDNLMEAYGLVGEPPPLPSDGYYFKKGAKPYEGQITVIVENDSFMVNVTYPPDLPIEQHSYYAPHNEATDQYQQRIIRSTLSEAERFFGPVQVISTEDGMVRRTPPWRIDVRTQLPVPWPEGEEPPPYDYSSDPAYQTPGM